MQSRFVPLIGCLVPGLDIASEILSFSSNCLYVVVLFHFEKVEFALEGLRQFFVAGEMEEVTVEGFCDMHETPWYGTSGSAVCLPFFGM